MSYRGLEKQVPFAMESFHMYPPDVGEDIGREDKQIYMVVRTPDKAMKCPWRNAHTIQSGCWWSNLFFQRGCQGRKRDGSCSNPIVQLQIMNLPKPKDVQVYSILSEGHVIAGLDSRTKRKQSGRSCWQQSSAQTPGRYLCFEAWKLLHWQITTVHLKRPSC